jgi:hypothetical protein
VTKKGTKQGIEKEEKKMDPVTARARATLMRHPTLVSNEEEQKLKRLDPRRDHQGKKKVKAKKTTSERH